MLISVYSVVQLHLLFLKEWVCVEGFLWGSGEQSQALQGLPVWSTNPLLQWRSVVAAGALAGGAGQGDCL